MNKTYNAHERKRKTASRRKKELALALAVSLWIATGSVASAQETTITADHDGNVYGNHNDTGWGTYTAAPNNNTVTMTGGTVTGKFLDLAGAYWGRSTETTMSNNKLDIRGGTIGEFNFLAGALTLDGEPEYDDVKTRNVTNNAVILGGTAQIGTGDICGALTGTGDATGNSVAITGLAIDVKGIFGGLVERNGDAKNNTVTISGGSVSCSLIYGGQAGGDSGNATGNMVTLKDVSVTTPWVAGGIASGDADATHNTVSLANSTVTGDVYGGYTAVPGISGDFVTGNTLNLSGVNTAGAVANFETVNLKSAAWGTPVLTAGDFKSVTNIDVSGLAFTNPGAASGSTTLLSATSGLDTPTLTVTSHTQTYTNSPLVAGVTIDGTLTGNITNSASAVTYTLASNTVNKIAFGDVEWKDSGALMTRPTNITFAGANVDTSNINFTNIQSLEANKKMTLVSSFGDTVGTITGTKYKVGSTLEGEGKASLVGNDLIFTAETSVGNENLTPQEQTHNTVMGATAGLAALSAGNDFIGAATEGLALASNAGADGVSSFAQMGGGSMRQETGSHVDTHTWNAILALGHKNEKERGTFEYGAFFEYGSGNYTTHNGDERGDGSMHYTGGGLLAKWTQTHGLYVEGSLRAGTVHDDARNVLRDADGAPYSYETNAPYMGFHLGVGKEFTLNNGNVVDVYGKYFYNRRNSVDFNAGGHYDLDAVTSQVLRVGARYTIKGTKWDFYAGAAYEHELDGKANGTADGVAIRGADTSGASFRGELGATVTPDKNVPVTLDFNLTGFAGKKQGVSGGVSVSFTF